MSVIDILSNGNYIVVNKKIASELGLFEAILLGELASEHKYWESRGELIDNFFYSTIENIKENTTLSERQQRTALNALKSKGIVTVEIRGIPAKRFMRINEDKVLPYLLNNVLQNAETSYCKTQELDTAKRQGNNNNLNNNKNNNKTNKERKKEESPDATYDDVINSATDNEELRDLYKEYIRMRKLNKSPMTNRALQLLINKNVKLSDGNEEMQKSMLETAIMNNWKSVYPPKEQSGGYGAHIEVINGERYEVKNGKYYVPGGSGVAVDPFAKDDLPF